MHAQHPLRTGYLQIPVTDIMLADPTGATQPYLGAFGAAVVDVTLS